MSNAPAQGSSKKSFQIKIGTKLVVIIATLLVLVIASVSWITAETFLYNSQSLITDINVDSSADISEKLRSKVSAVLDRSKTFAKNLLEENESSILLQQRVFFEKNPEVLGILVLSHSDATEDVMIIQSASQVDIDFNSTLKQLNLTAKDLQSGSSHAAVVKDAKGNHNFAISTHFLKAEDKFTHSILLVTNKKIIDDLFQDIFGMTGYLINKEGILLAKSSELDAKVGESILSRDIVKQAKKSSTGDGQLRFKDPKTQNWQLGVFRSADLAEMTVLTEILESVAFAATQRAQLRTGLMAIVILCFSLILALFFADSITYPIGQLSKAAKQVGEGNFKTRVHINTHDELSQLGETFNEMAKGLEEREKVKSVFNKFHNKEIAQLLLNGDIKLGGERKNVAILFSDIRSFTTMSESMEPEEVVEMLNEYMSAMVKVIRTHHGVIDKFVGDAIIALWGVPDSNPNDIENAVKAALGMRKSLKRLNLKRELKGKPPLSIGIGINYGPAVAGNMGSEEKMEYTVLGDSVNLTSRIESMTKELNTDLLVSESIANALHQKYPFQNCGNFHVKGKTQEVTLYKIPDAEEDTNQERPAA